MITLTLALCPLMVMAGLRPEEQKLYDDSRSTMPPSVVRREAHALLDQVPTSFVAAYVLGWLEVGDGQYAEGIRDLKSARALAATRSITTPPDQVELDIWRARIILALADALDFADRLDEALSTWDEAELLHSALGGMPDRTRRRIDALLKLGRIAEAQQVAETRLRKPDLSDADRLAVRVAAARILFAQEPDGAKAYAAFESIAQDAAQTPGFTPPFGDLAFHAHRQGQIPKALEYLALSAAHTHATSAAHPHRTRAEIQLSAAQWEAARNELRQAWNLLQTKRADIRYELIPDTRLTAAHFYLAAGYPERAEQLTRPYVTLPIRSGFTSRPPEQWQAGVNLLCWSASRQIRKMEMASARLRPWRERAALLFHHTIRRIDEAILARHIRALILTQVEHKRPIRDALAMVDAPVWLWGDLASILGPRPFRALLNTYPLHGAPRRFFTQALDIEAAWAAKDWALIAEQGPAAWEAIPQEEALLRARICQFIAEAEYQRGQTREGIPWLERAYEANPATSLLTGSRLPVSRRPPEFAGSPLLAERPEAPNLTVLHADHQASCRLAWSSGTETTTPPMIADDNASFAQRSHRLHRQLFSPVGLLDDAAFAALEGHALAGPAEKEDRMDRMLRSKKDVAP